MTDLDGRGDVGGGDDNLGGPWLHSGCKSPAKHNNKPRHRDGWEEFVALIFWENITKIKANNKQSSGAEPSRTNARQKPHNN